MTNISGDVN